MTGNAANRARIPKTPSEPEGALPLGSPQLLILVRHAESEHHVKRLTGGWTDSPLTELGHEQARCVAKRLQTELSGYAVQVYTSDQRRAMQTAEAIGKALGSDPKADDRLREYNNGEAANLTWEEAEARFPGPWGLRGAVDARRYPGSETLREFFERTGGFLDNPPPSANLEGPLVLVTHGGTIHCLVARWLDLPVELVEQTRFDTHTTAVSVLYTDEHGIRAVERLNDASHLTEPRFGLGALAARLAG